MKKVLTLLLAATLILSVTGCDDSGNANQPADSDTSANSATSSASDTSDIPYTSDTTAAVTTPTEPEPARKFDLSVPPDLVIGNGTIWGWVSDGTDEVENGVEVSAFQESSYLIIECGESPDLDAWFGLAWQSEYDWSWHEDFDLYLEDYVTDDDVICLPLYDVLEDYASFRNGDAKGKIKLYFRYGDENDESQKDYMETLDIQSVIFANYADVRSDSEHTP
ncbi:MAG: hypothetical protein FWF82_05715 [Oscillospiraceae bacterium]|nr:hypothetical protein [Oscillospiraceae bacterium]